MNWLRVNLIRYNLGVLPEKLKNRISSRIPWDLMSIYFVGERGDTLVIFTTAHSWRLASLLRSWNGIVSLVSSMGISPNPGVNWVPRRGSDCGGVGKSDWLPKPERIAVEEGGDWRARLVMFVMGVAQMMQVQLRLLTQVVMHFAQSLRAGISHLRKLGKRRGNEGEGTVRMRTRFNNKRGCIETP